MARNPSRFATGSGVFACRCCTRKTRATGRGDNEGVALCGECYDLAGEDNHYNDHGGTFYSSAQEVLRLIAVVADKGGNVACWDEMKARALRMLGQEAPAAEAPAPAAPALVEVAPAVADGIREAAPELLQALVMMLAKHDDRDGLSDLWPKEAQAARAAIKKALRIS